MTPEQKRELAKEIVYEVRNEAFEGDKWIGGERAIRAVIAVLDRGIGMSVKTQTLEDVLLEIDGRGEPHDGTKSFIHRDGRYLSGMPYAWTAFAERAFIFQSKQQARDLILRFKELAGSDIGSFA